MHLLSDEQLLRELRGDKAALAFRTLYERFAEKLYRLAYQKTASAQTAEEIVQEVFVGVWEKRENLLIGHVENYLLSAVRYQVINQLRAVIAQRKFVEPREQASLLMQEAELPLTVEDLQNALEKSLEVLPEKTRQIFRLSRYEYLSHREIAQRLDLTEKAVEYHITQALRHLRTHLRDFLTVLLLVHL
ncbi:RNA polymerase sigma-70 factor [Runella slithyformis]|uniref:RNA polymerase, sigma-24 subunit, ECF subfamily n=1 Tax=Runella slithyformis (strain ATCC 29530 / DSM 19594 / LMG 11500 / NCIMB 11436 / LSU 4) TaxID=761193 RepID=A0A7U3ZHQ2_RUNSL|nr:RNA polymerase sigma-70 factor [Runella slithyformis]AEI47427.1 RNA polymerase, sigma-24 subunit, ECF subfamily [Runella slithyformis DSM 19594]